MAGGQRLKVWPLQIFGHHIVERLLFIGWREFLGNRNSVCVADIFEHLPPQRAVADRRQARFKFVEQATAGTAGILCAKAFGVAEGIIVDDADKAIELHERILEGRRRQQHLWYVGERGFKGAPNFVIRSVDIPQTVGFIDDDEIPRRDHELVGMARGKLERADNDSLLLERALLALFDHFVVVARFENECRQKEFFFDLLRPLLTKVSRTNNQDEAFAFRPFLGKDEARFDGFSKTDFIGENGALGQRRLERKERGLNLVRVEIDLRVEQCSRQFFGVGNRMAPAEFMGEEFCVVVSYHSLAPPFGFMDWRSIHWSISVRRKRQDPPTLKPGISPPATSR